MSSIACRVQSGGAGRLHRQFAILIALAIAAFALAAPANAQTANPFGATNAPGARPDLRSLFASWEQADRQAAAVSAATNRAAMAAAPQSGGTVLAIPSIKPVASYRLTSSFGTRSDPFAGSRRMHNGLDMAGPLGTPIYATADGIVGRAQWVGGYGNYIEVNHGGGIQTRYGHLSEILVGTNVRVTRGQLIGRMGSTGRSTGSHLHYEVRIEGRPVNPTPFLTSTDYLAALDSRPGAGGTQIALGASQ
ncbi:MAG: M23 family metallopeptidase [Sphingomonadaceae bacterium]|nr:M23 family metallopeptidase [Sphingomonadaceae bacterium]